MNYRVLIVDDEKINIAIVKKIITANFSQIEIVGEASSVEEFLEISNKVKPDILLLDINLGNREVFEVLDDLVNNPQIIFISSAKNYALEAFRFSAVDFVLKPIKQDILTSAILKAMCRIELERGVKNTVINSQKNPEGQKKIVISSLDKHEILKIEEILFCKAEGRCTLFFLKDGRKIYSYKNLMEYDFLHENYNYFIKVSRSHIVNFEYVIKVIKKVGVYCELINGIYIPVSRRKIPEFNKFIHSFI